MTVATQFMACESATYGNEFFTLTSGTVTADSTVTRKSSPRSWKMDLGSPAVAALLQKSAVMADAGRRCSAWFNFPSVAPAAVGTFLAVRNAASTGIIQVRLNTNGKLQAAGIGAPNVNGSATLAANTWYRIGLSYTISSTTSFEIRVYVNGALDITISSNGTLTNVTTNQIILTLATALGANFIAYTDELYVDNGTDLADPGNIAITAKLPASVNTGGFDTTLGTGAVNERAISLTNGMQDAAIHDVQQNYTLQAANAGDRDISEYPLVARTAWIWAKQATGAAGTPKLMDNGSESAITLTTAAAMYTIITDSTSYPSNAAGIGMRSANTGNDTFLYECGTMIAYYESRQFFGDVFPGGSLSTPGTLGLGKQMEFGL